MKPGQRRGAGHAGAAVRIAAACWASLLVCTCAIDERNPGAPESGEEDPSERASLRPFDAPLGAACAGDSECTSGFCTDGVCCERRCEDVCASCNQPDAAGSCRVVATDPACLPPSQAAASDCRSYEPAGVTVTCAALGMCRRVEVDEAFVAVDAPEGSACAGALGTCNAEGSCVVAGKKGLGEGCASDDECAEAHCVSGRCCDAACDGLCQACGLDGRCTAVPDSEPRCEAPACPPNNACRSYLATDGACAAFGRCAESSACSFTEQRPASECDCDAAGVCRLALGASCSANAECSSDACISGRCCNRLCAACEVCSMAGLCVDSGQCECAPGETATCGTVHASAGECAARSLTCLPEGRWPDATACAATSVEICDAARVDEDCDGASNERPPCEGFTQIDAGRGHTCGVTTTGAVACWGDNSQGQLGDGTRESRRSPVRVANLPATAQVSAKGGQTCALATDGSVRCWGDNRLGGAGSADPADQLLPVVVSLPARALQVACAAGGPNASCALLQGGTVRCWGSLVGSNPTPVDIGMTGIQAITAGFNHVCAIGTDGTAHCWGSGSEGALGDGTTTGAFDRVTTVSGLSDVRSISAGSSHTCAALGTGAVRCWGLGDNGRLGNGATLLSSSPVTVTGVSNAVSVGVGEFHSCAVLADGSARCWGANNGSQIGDGSRGVDRLTPVPVANASGTSTVTAGQIHSCALRSDGSAICWGANASGALGNPDVMGFAPSAVSVQGP